MQRHKRAIARAVATDGWAWSIGGLIFAGSALALWGMLH